MCKLETPTCHVARQEGHGWALALNGTPNRRPRFYAVKLYSSLFKCILHRIAPFKCFIHPPLVALFTLAMISKLFGGCCIAMVVKHLIHTRQITQFQSSWTKNNYRLLPFSQIQCSWWNNMANRTNSFWPNIFVPKDTTNILKACFWNFNIGFWNKFYNVARLQHGKPRAKAATSDCPRLGPKLIRQVA